MDSIRFDLKGYNIKDKQVITIEKITQQKSKKLHFGVQAGYGYGVINRKPDIWVGVGISYNF